MSINFNELIWLQAWNDRKYSRSLWGELDGFKPHLYWNRFTSCKKEEREDKAMTMATNLAVLINRYHSHIVPNLEQQAQLAAQFRRPGL